MTTAQTPAIDGYCPVAYFLADKPLKGSSEFVSSYEGKDYLLVSEEAKSVFDADPAKYVPAFGGTCAFGASINEVFEIDPTSFKIVDDQLLLFLKTGDTDAQALWNKEDEATLMQKAKANFPVSK